MSLRDVRPLRRRSVALVVAAAALSSLVILPVVGLVRIERTTSRSHEFTQVSASLDQLTNGLVRAVTGPFATYGNTRTASSRTESEQAIATARSLIADIERREMAVADWGLTVQVENHLNQARVIADGAESFLEEIDGGATVANAPSTRAVVGATNALLASQGQVGIAASPVRLELNEERRNSVREAQYLLGASVVVALLGLGALIVLDHRRVVGYFATQDARRESAERLAAHRADVVNMASHELRNPLTVLTLSTDLMSRAASQRSDTEMTELAVDAHVAALRCQSLVNELLDLGRLDADRLQLRLGATPLLPALNEAVAMSAAHHGERDVTLAGDTDLRVSADGDRLKIILRNLVDNAFKYSPPGTPVFVTVGEWEGRVRIDVQDEGRGIPEAYRERIFQRFERLNPADHVSGVGIGLYLSRELARRMDGDLRCSESERGAAFRLELPAVA